MHTSLLQPCTREIAWFASAEGKGTENETAFFCDVSHRASRERGSPPVKCLGRMSGDSELGSGSRLLEWWSSGRPLTPARGARDASEGNPGS
ncbi:hypothetical protein GW17_00032931, partial [Ensete ventricosum]